MGINVNLRGYLSCTPRITVNEWKYLYFYFCICAFKSSIVYNIFLRSPWQNETNNYNNDIQILISILDFVQFLFYFKFWVEWWICWFYNMCLSSRFGASKLSTKLQTITFLYLLADCLTREHAATWWKSVQLQKLV